MPPTINHFLQQLMHQKLPTTNNIKWISWGSEKIIISLGYEKLSFLMCASLMEHKRMLWMANKSPT